MIFSHVLYRLSYLGTSRYSSRAVGREQPPSAIRLPANSRPAGLQSPQGRARTMRFVYNDPYALRGAVHEMAGSEPVATRERDLPIPVDVYQLDNEIVIEGAIPGARLEDLELSCEDELLTLQGEVAAVVRDFAIQEIPRGRFSRTLAL